jgi:3-oxoacyl-[acyl-carrier protein] reductase
MTSNSEGWAERVVPPPGTRVAVAGGCGGIGRAVVSACQELGHRVAVFDLPQSMEAYPSSADLVVQINATDEATVRRGFQRLEAAFDALDALVFLIGFTLTPPRPTSEINSLDWDEVVRGNLASAHLVTREALPLLRRGNAPSIVTVSSGLGVSVLGGYGPYAASKAGLIALTKTLATENSPTIRANTVAPSAIRTDFMKGGLGRIDSDGSWFDPTPYVPMIPLGRLAEVRDVVGPILFLASPAAAFVTGQTLHVNGGRFMP